MALFLCAPDAHVCVIQVDEAGRDAVFLTAVATVLAHDDNDIKSSMDLIGAVDTEINMGAALKSVHRSFIRRAIKKANARFAHMLLAALL